MRSYARSKTVLKLPDRTRRRVRPRNAFVAAGGTKRFVQRQPLATGDRSDIESSDPLMGRPLLSSLRHHSATVVAIALLAGAGPPGCGVTGPAPDRHGDDAGARTAGGTKPADPGPTRLLLRLGERRL